MVNRLGSGSTDGDNDCWWDDGVDVLLDISLVDAAMLDALLAS